MESEKSDAPLPARRRENLKSTIRSGRTIGEQRERLETANERMAARQKDKRKKHLRVLTVSIVFISLGAILVGLYLIFVKKPSDSEPEVVKAEIFTPTIEIIDEDSIATSGKITGRMQNYIGQAEADFRSLGYTPIKAVVPGGAVREVDFFLEGYPGFIKMYIDRGTAVSVEDADRMLRYLAGQGITEFEYIDVRIPYKAYWK